MNFRFVPLLILTLFTSSVLSLSGCGSDQTIASPANQADDAEIKAMDEQIQNEEKNARR
ncbi:hypothetical protein SH668x_000728 [Planctomicrobium sp. SH668]|uniref:hypothetical protein n=1 Tax=Planctomicrobium sp. SH668 TaxID=3448126 RepID=UPI003F5B43F0